MLRDGADVTSHVPFPRAGVALFSKLSTATVAVVNHVEFCVFCCQGILAMVVGFVTVVCYCLVVVLLFKRVVRVLVSATGRFDGFCRAVKPSNSAYSICIFQTSLCTLFSCMCITNCETIKTMKNSFRFYMLKPFVTSQDLTETLKAISNYDLTSYVV